MRYWLTIAFLLVSTLALGQSDDTLTPDRKKALDTFFSNFSEADMQGFAIDRLSDAAMLDFALRHIYINRFKSLKQSKDGTSVSIPAAMVDEATDKYFGRKIGKHAKQSYPVPLADGESYTFSQIERLVKAGADLYRADGAIFTAGSGSTLDPHATPAQWQKQGEEATRTGGFEALIKSQGKRFILLEYTLTDGQAQAPRTEPAQAQAAAATGSPIPIAVLGKTLEIRPDLTRDQARAAMSAIVTDAPSLDTAERLQYDLPLAPEQAPATFLFDFDGNGALTGFGIDAMQKEQNPPVVALLAWLKGHAGASRRGREGQVSWIYGGWRIEHRDGGDGEDSVYRVEIAPATR